MSSKPLEISKPHYFNRFDQSPKISLKHECHQSPISSVQQSHRPHQLILTSHLQKDEIRQLKLTLLNMFLASKDSWERELQQKQVFIKTFREEHRKNMEIILAEIEGIRKKAYEQYKHNCVSRKEGSCWHCNERSKALARAIEEYIEDGHLQGEDNKSFSKKKKKLKSSNKDKTNRRVDQSETSQINSREDADQINQSEDVFQINIHARTPNSHAISGKENISYDFLKNALSQNMQENGSDGLLENTLYVFKSRSKERMLSSINKRSISKRRTNLNGGESSEKSIKDGEKNMRGSKSINTMIRNNRGPREDTLQYENSKGKEVKNNLNTQQGFGYRRSTRYSNTRKSLIKHPTIGEGNQGGNSHRSKFYPQEEDNLPDENYNKIVSRHQEYSKTVKTLQGKSSKSSSPFSTRVDLQKQKKKGLGKKKVMGLDDEEILIDLDEEQSIKLIQHTSQIQIQEDEEARRAVMQHKQYKKDDKNNKMSRYRREKLFYTMLKRQINDCLSASAEQLQQESERQDAVEPIQSIAKDITQKQIKMDHESLQNKYSILERKRSLITKLNMLNQTSNFEDIRAKIEMVLESKDEYLIEKTGKELLNVENSGPAEGTKREIIQKFLADVLKIVDLKRLLKNKFSKELTWGQKMRQMHQFYTYLEYSLQNFRSNLIKSMESNWQQIGWQGQEIEFDVEDFDIDEDIGHYKGLENVELNEYEHHKQIECSMKYYGIEIKKIEKLNNFSQAEPKKFLFAPSNNVAQKSLKQIKQIPEEELQVELEPENAKKVTFS